MSEEATRASVKEQIMKNFGVEQEFNIRFIEPKKVLVKMDERDDVREDVVSIEILSVGGLKSVDITSCDEGTFSTALSNIKGLTVLD